MAAVGRKIVRLEGGSGGKPSPDNDVVIAKIQKYLGEDMEAESLGEGYSDLRLKSKDGTKQIRFDILHSHGDEPHVNIETFELIHQ